MPWISATRSLLAATSQLMKHCTREQLLESHDSKNNNNNNYNNNNNNNTNNNNKNKNNDNNSNNNSNNFYASTSRKPEGLQWLRAASSPGTQTNEKLIIFCFFSKKKQI
ncbi:unnamed protein product [Polarella glacialis]|uniref:Uncharacterized protein n=1 Tax=Polarella glacialis TaxID=89957 RepID=A0A813HJ83_POLGL|nr:unnamed protein product [Polarella glacialis]